MFVPSPNYPAHEPTNVNPISKLYSLDPSREALCDSAFPPPSFCFTQGVLCTAEDVEVIAAYDPAMLTPGFEVNGFTLSADPSLVYAHGVNLTFTLPTFFSLDEFKCTDIDPSTGLPVVRRLNLFIACDSSVSGLHVIDFTERAQCHYYITASSAAACCTAVPPSLPPPTAPSSTTLSAPAVAGIASAVSALLVFAATTFFALSYPVATWGIWKWGKLDEELDGPLYSVN